MPSSSTIIIDGMAPKNTQLQPKYKRSFAYVTIKDRIPVILTKALDRLVRDKESIIAMHGEKAREEVKQVVGSISQLKHEVMTDKPFTEFGSYGEKDEQIWNELLKTMTKEIGCSPTYFSVDWMYSESYVYRRLREAFVTTKVLKNIDPFHVNKSEALHESLAAIKPLAILMNKIVLKTYNSDEEIKRELFHLIKISLWGNKCDLSLSCGSSVEVKDISASLIKEYDPFILIDESESIWDIIKESKGEIIDIILDNAGYEVTTDLCLAEYLLKVCQVKKIRIRAKRIPWYVSDTMEKDFHYVINTLAEQESPFLEMANRWLTYVKEGKIELYSDNFWTLPYCFHAMEKVDKTLYDDLGTSKLLIFKGDLNYRKLVGDVNWETTEPFKNALQGFLPAPLATLRTLKADTICGLKQGQAEKAQAQSSNWQLTGDFAVIQLAKK